jgi:phosphohistidine phosphatase
MTLTRRLLLVRHAKSDQALGLADHERPLNERGRRDATAMGRWLTEDAMPDAVRCSTAVRTRQTWQLTGVPAPVEFDRDLYLSSPAATLAVIALVDSAVRTLAIVGHEPTQSELTQELLDSAGEHNVTALAELQRGFVTSAIAVLESPASHWQLTPGSCRLVDFVVPRG